jgi:hypothetical protein
MIYLNNRSVDTMSDVGNNPYNDVIEVENRQLET